MGAHRGLEHENQTSGVEGCVGVTLLTLRAENQIILPGFHCLSEHFTINIYKNSRGGFPGVRDFWQVSRIKLCAQTVQFFGAIQALVQQV